MENLPRGRRSRRSSSNLNLSNISPLTTHFGLTTVDDAGAISPHYSYIHGASAPSTPSILSRAPSRKRTLAHQSTLSVPGTPRADAARLSKSKSVSYLLEQRRQTSYFEPRSRTTRHADSTEWVHRAGIALTSEARESKGQSWLARRASSTSLLSTGGSDSEADGEAVMVRRRIPRGSRSQPDFQTAAAAARRSASHPRLQRDSSIGAMHPFAPDFIDEAFTGSSFDDEFDEQEYIADGDYGDDGDDDDGEEELHWSKRPRTGLAAWVDRMVGWSLFSVDDGIDSDDEEEDYQYHYHHKHSHNDETTAPEPPRLTLPDTTDAVEAGPANPPREDVSIWADAGWVLSLAAQVVFQ
ncbi:hypothetical protein DRE_03779 [Drechslerella stenobrocha 248]|uniref:Uncharacterized protein n=1 Tax=Drechslerella stenobrocha 248 TaxID=1043628 RepID=W7I3Q2_9PEZI|nr:hypothetical protein DRE_03779 [Drechslerella stenobrocha 248]